MHKKYIKMKLTFTIRIRASVICFILFIILFTEQQQLRPGFINPIFVMIRHLVVWFRMIWFRLVSFSLVYLLKGISIPYALFNAEI